MNDPGRLAQLVEHQSYKLRVVGSNPAPPTSLRSSELRLAIASKFDNEFCPRSLGEDGPPSDRNQYFLTECPRGQLKLKYSSVLQLVDNDCQPFGSAWFESCPQESEILLNIGIQTGFIGAVAQLVRASACHAEGREFESRQPRQSSPTGASPGMLSLEVVINSYYTRKMRRQSRRSVCEDGRTIKSLRLRPFGLRLVSANDKFKKSINNILRLYYQISNISE